MNEAIEQGRWRVVWGPVLDEERESWIVVFRMDDRPRDTEGPQIIVTSSATTGYDSYDPEQDITYDVEYSYTTSFEYQVWAPDRKLIVHRCEQAPYGWHNWAPSLQDDRDEALSVVQQFAEDPGFWKWDGSAETLGQ
jgi:hypothetical protein